MIDTKKIHISFCTDTGYMMPCGVAIISVCENNKNTNICFHLVITVKNGETIDEVNTIIDIITSYHQEYKIYELNEESISNFVCSGSSYISTTAFARIFLPNILSDDISKVLYLDGDIAVNGSLEDLWNIELPVDCPLGGIIDSCGTSVSYRDVVKMPLSLPYINSGILLMNLDVWRREGLTAKAAECATAHKFPFLDQDTLNYLLQGRIMLLPIKYNVQTLFLFNDETKWNVEYTYLQEIREAVKNPVVVHYVSANKPWLDEYCPLREIWKKYCDMSEWKDMPLGKLNCRFDRSFLNKPFTDAYWSDAELMKESLVPFIRLFNAAVRIRNKRAIIRVVSMTMNVLSSFLEYLYQYKTRNLNGNFSE